MLMFDLHFIEQSKLLTDVDLTGLQVCNGSPSFAQNSFELAYFQLVLQCSFVCFLTKHSTINLEEKIYFSVK